MNEQTEELTAEIEATRERLGETVGALSERLDVKKHAQEKVEDAKQRVSGVAHRRDVRTGAAAAAATGLLVTAIKTYRRSKTDRD